MSGATAFTTLNSFHILRDWLLVRVDGTQYKNKWRTVDVFFSFLFFSIPIFSFAFFCFHDVMTKKNQILGADLIKRLKIHGSVEFGSSALHTVH